MSAEENSSTLDKNARIATIKAISNQPNQSRIPQLLILAATDADVDIREAAVEGLALSSAPEAMTALIAVLGDADGKIRMCAANALKTRGDTNAIDALLHALWTEDDKPNPVMRKSDEAKIVATTIVEALVILGGPPVTDELIRIFRSNRPVRQEIAAALGMDANTQKADAKRLAKKVRLATVLMLRNQPYTISVPRFIHIAQTDPDNDVRCRALS